MAQNLVASWQKEDNKKIILSESVYIRLKGLINLTKSLALILSDKKIIAICPNWVKTESIKNMDQEYLKEEMKRIGQKKLIKPEKIANKVLELVENNISSGEIIVMEDSNE